MNTPTLARAYTTHRVDSPTDRYIVGVCSQVECVRYHRGWWMFADERDEGGRLIADLIRSGRHGRTFREDGVNAAGVTTFWFEPYQRCFEEHRTRPELFVVTAGTPTTNLGEIRRHQRPEFFVEDYRETLDRRLTSKQKG